MTDIPVEVRPASTSVGPGPTPDKPSSTGNRNLMARARSHLPGRLRGAPTVITGTEFARSAFTTGMATTKDYDHTRWGGIRKAAPLPGKFNLSDEMITDIATPLQQHLTDLLNLRNGHLLDGDNHRQERILLDQLTEKGAINVTKVEEFIRKDPEGGRGLITSLMQMRVRTQMELFALGLDMVAVWNTSGRIPRTMTLNVDAVAREWRNGWRTRPGGTPMTDRRNRRMWDRGAGVLGGTVGAAAGTTLGAIASFGTGVVDAAELLKDIASSRFLGTVGAGVVGGRVGALLGRRFLSENGDIDINACKQGLAMIKNLDPKEREYIKKVSGIDLGDFVVDAHGNIVYNTAGGRNLRSASIFGLQEKIRSRLDTMADFYNVIGKKRPITRRVPFPRFTSYNHAFEDIDDTPWDRRINEAFERRFDADPAGDQLLYYLEAQEEVLGDYVSEMMEQVFEKTFDPTKGEWIDYAEEATQLENRLNAEGEDLAEERHHHDTTARHLNEDINRLLGTAPTEGGGPRTGGELTPLQNAANLLGQELARATSDHEFVIANSMHVNGIAITPAITLQDVRNRIQIILTGDHTIAGSLAAQEHEALHAAVTGMETRREAELALVLPDEHIDPITNVHGVVTTPGRHVSHEDQRQRINARIDAEITRLNTRLTDIKTTLETQIGNLNSRIQQQTERAAGTDQTPVEHTPNVIPDLDRLAQACDTLLDMGFTLDMIATMPPAVINGHINFAHGLGIPNTWPAGQNNSLVHRDLINHAHIEAEARRRAVGDSILTSGIIVGHYQDLTDPNIGVGLGFNREEILTMSEDELTNRAHSLHAAEPLLGWDAAQDDVFRQYIRSAKTYLHQTIRIRTNVYGEFTRDLQEQVRYHTGLAQDPGPDGPENMRQPKRQGKIVVEVMRNQFDRLSELQHSFDIEERRNLLLDQAQIPIDQGSVYTIPERELHIEGGYYAWLDSLTGYFSDTQREAKFRMLNDLLPREELARILYDSDRLNLLGAPVLIGGAPDLGLVFEEIQLNLENGNITSNDLRAAGVDIINYLRGEIWSRLPQPE